MQTSGGVRQLPVSSAAPHAPDVKSQNWVVSEHGLLKSQESPASGSVEGLVWGSEREEAVVSESELQPKSNISKTVIRRFLTFMFYILKV